MKINMNLPAPMEASSAFDSKKNVLEITPRFYRGQPNAIVGRISVCSEKGISRDFVLAVGGGSGNLLVTETNKTVKPRFDEMSAEEYRRDRDRRAAAPRGKQKQSPPGPPTTAVPEPAKANG